MLLSEKESKNICDKLLSLTRADDAEVSIFSDDYSHLRFAANNFTTNGRREDASASVTVWIDKKRGSASASDLEDSSLKAAVAQAEELARISPGAKAIGHIIRACEKDGVIGAGFHHANGSASAFATKNGNFHYHRTSLASLSVTARTPDGGSSGYFLRNHFDINKLDAERIGREAVKKALTSKSPQLMEPGVYPVILEAQAADDLIGLGFDARSADEGRSPYSAPDGKTKVGEKILDERLSFYSDPWHPELPGSPVAQGGIPAEKIYFVRNGVLGTLSYSRFWAKEKGKEPTPGPVNSILESSAPPASLDDMIKSMDRGLLVSRFWYIRMVDPKTALFTGLTRDGVWYIEHGKIQHPVKNFRFNQSVLELLAPGNVQMIGRSERVSNSEIQGRSASLTPAIKVKAFHFTSQSEAV